MLASYINTNSLLVSGDLTAEFLPGRRIKADCGVDGIKYSTISSSSYSNPSTTVIISEDVLTSNLTDVWYGIINIGDEGSLPDHAHDGMEGHGGQISLNDLTDVNISFLELTGTPTTYSGTEGLFAYSTGSGILFASVSGSGSFYFGEGEPVVTGAINNVYLDTLTGDMYQKIRESGSLIEQDACVSGTGLASNAYNNNHATYGGPAAFDDNTGTLWHSDNSGYPMWIQYQFSESMVIGKIGFFHLGTFPTRMPKNFTIKGSNTGSFSGEETDIVSYSNQVYTSGVWKYFTFDNLDPFLYYRVYITSADNNYQNIYEIEMFEIDTSGWEKQLDAVNSFLELTDTPPSYVDQEGKYLKVLASGIVFVDSPPQTFLDLTDTPTTYSGSEGKYLITTASGVSYSNQLYKGKQSVKVEYKDDEEVYINPGIVDVDGVLQEINTRTTVSDSYSSSTWYFVYIDQSGSLTVSSGIPTLDYNKMGYYNDGDRCIGFFMTTAAGDIRRFSTFGQDYVFEEAAVADYRDRPWGTYTTAETVTLTSVPLDDDICIHFSGEANVSTSQSVFELSTTDSVNTKRLTKGVDYIAGRCSMRCFNKQVVVTCINASDFYLAVDGFILPSYIYTGA